MAGTSCLNCIFSQWSDQKQTGCALHRLDHYESVDILNDNQNGFYKVLPRNVCTAKRDKKWLSDHPRNPVDSVRSELFPKIQLIILIDEVNSFWVEFFAKADFSKYSAIDVLFFQPERDFMTGLGFLYHSKNFFIHACCPVERTICSVKEHHINNFVRKDCQFYILVDNPANTRVRDWPLKLDNFLNERCESVLLAAELDKDGEAIPYNNMLVYTPLHLMLGGHGTQCVEEKISIHAVNHDQGHLVRYAEEILEEKVNGTTNS